MAGIRRNLVPEIVRQAPGYITLYEPDGVILWSNKISFGLDDSILGQPSEPLIHPEDRQKWREWFARVIHGRETIDYAVRGIAPVIDTWLTYQGRMSPFIEHGAARYVITFCYEAYFTLPIRPAERFMLSPMERTIVRTLLVARDSLKSHAIALRIGLPKSTSSLRVTLANLAERGILTLADGGYAVGEEFKATALDLLK